MNSVKRRSFPFPDKISQISIQRAKGNLGRQFVRANESGQPLLIFLSYLKREKTQYRLSCRHRPGRFPCTNACMWAGDLGGMTGAQAETFKEGDGNRLMGKLELGIDSRTTSRLIESLYVIKVSSSSCSY